MKDMETEIWQGRKLNKSGIKRNVKGSSKQYKNVCVNISLREDFE